ncbi:unnamed protein product [Ectocarpus sp. 6 AP-2014]
MPLWPKEAGSPIAQGIFRRYRGGSPRIARRRKRRRMTRAETSEAGVRSHRLTRNFPNTSRP